MEQREYTSRSALGSTHPSTQWAPVAISQDAGRSVREADHIYFRPEDGNYVSPKCWYLPMSPHGVTVQNNIDVFTAVRTSNLTHTFRSDVLVELHLYAPYTLSRRGVRHGRNFTLALITLRMINKVTGVKFPAWTRIFLFASTSDRPSGPISLLSHHTKCSFLGVKAIGA
jgi:hypothetical protein